MLSPAALPCEIWIDILLRVHPVDYHNIRLSCRFLNGLFTTDCLQLRQKVFTKILCPHGINAIFFAIESGLNTTAPRMMDELCNIFVHHYPLDQLHRVVIQSVQDRNETAVQLLLSAGTPRHLFHYPIRKSQLYGIQHLIEFLSRFNFHTAEDHVSDDEFHARLAHVNSTLFEWILDDQVRRELYQDEYQTVYQLFAPSPLTSTSTFSHHLDLVRSWGIRDLQRLIYWYERLFVQACWLRSIDIAAMLLEEVGVDVNSGHPGALGPALVNRHVEIVRLLLEYGAASSDTPRLHRQHSNFASPDSDDSNRLAPVLQLLLTEFGIHHIHI